MQSTQDPPVRPATLEEELRRELQFAPTHVLTEAGVAEIETRPVQATPIQVALMEEPVLLLTGIEWSGMAMAAQLDCLMAIDLPTDLIGTSDVLAVLPEQTKSYLTGWQQQVNDGSCWHTSGSIGREASELIHAGYILMSKEGVEDWIGNPMPTRDQVRAGAPGGPLYVKTMMGQAYLDWISAI